MAGEPGLGAYVARGVAARRAWLKLRQVDVAERIPGWSESQVSDIERGVRKVTADDLPLLCVALECDLATLVAGAPAELVDPLGVR